MSPSLMTLLKIEIHNPALSLFLPPVLFFPQKLRCYTFTSFISLIDGLPTEQWPYEARDICLFCSLQFPQYVAQRGHSIKIS